MTQTSRLKQIEFIRVIESTEMGLGTQKIIKAYTSHKINQI